MVGISEVIQTLGAMVIFSLILLTSNRMIQSNTLKEVESEAENIAITLAQSLIEEAQTKPFDAFTANGRIPRNISEDFTSVGQSGSGDFNDFDDYDNYSQSENTAFGDNSFLTKAKVFYIEPPNYDTPTATKTYYKKMVVTVTSNYLRNGNQEIKLSYLRRYYKTTN